MALLLGPRIALVASASKPGLPLVNIVPGAIPFGSWAATATDDASLPKQGAPGDYGYDDKPAANWDAVMYDEVTDEYIIGVSAWKPPTYANYALGRVGEAKSVAFAVNGGDWVEATQTMTSPQTGLGDLFCARIRAADFEASGQIEVRAIVTPWVGKPRVLQGFPTISGASKFNAAEQWSLVLYVNKSGPRPVRYLSPTGSDSADGLTAATPMLTTETAIASIKSELGGSDIGGCRLRLLAGTYDDFGIYDPDWSGEAWTRHTTADTWFTVEAAPGVDADDIHVTTTAKGAGARLTKFRGVTLHEAIGTGGSVNNATSAVWLCACDVDGAQPGNIKTPSPFPRAGNGGVWWTETTMHDYEYGMASTASIMCRNVALDKCWGELYTQVRVILNAYMQNIQRIPPAHPDVFQYTNLTTPNIVMYKLVCGPGVAIQGFFSDIGGVLRDFAAVDCDFVRAEGSVGNIFKPGGTIQNALFLRLKVEGDYRKLEQIASATNMRFVDARSGGPVTYKQGVSYLYPGMAAGEPYDGAPYPSSVVTALGDAASGGKVASVYDATRTDKFTLEEDLTTGASQVSKWTYATAAGQNYTQSTANLRPTFATDAFGGATSALDFDKGGGSPQWVGITNVLDQIKGESEGEVWVLLDHQVDTDSPYAAETQYILTMGGSTSTGQLTLRREIVGGVHRLRAAVATTVPGSGTGSTAINTSVDDSSFIGQMIARVRKQTTGLTLTVYNAAYPAGKSASASSGVNGTFVTTGSSRTTIGGDYARTLAAGFQGQIQKVAVTELLDSDDVDDMLAAMWGDVVAV